MNTTRNQGRRLAIAGFALAVTCLHAALSTPDAARRAAESALGLLAGSAHATDLFVESTGVGIGTENPQRQLHLKGDNAVFRMDRNVGGASFFLVRTDSNWNPIKTFQIGVTASGPNNGEFIINDLGQAVAGYGINRMMITSTGETHFSGTVHAPSFVQTSSARFKDGIQTLGDANQAIQALRGVRFTWKESGQPAIGLIAEEVAQVYPELVAFENEAPAGVNYAALVAVLIEAIKAQQTTLDAATFKLKLQQAEVDQLKARHTELDELSRSNAQLTERLSALEALMQRDTLALR